MLLSIVCFVYSGMNRQIHDKVNVIRLDPEGSNHRHGSQLLCYATLTIFLLLLKSLLLQCTGVAHRTE